MTFNFRRSVTTLLLTLLVLALPRAAGADPGDPPEVEAQRLVHILGYTAGDYGGAVGNGAVINATEYAEQLALLAEARKIAAGLHAAGQPGAGTPGQAPADLAAQVDRVGALVDRKAPEAEVVAAVAAVRAAVTAAFQLAEAPTSPPDAARGKALYLEHCATCHGDDGHADTARARSLEPHPASFHDARIGDPLSPLRAGSTVRFGINGTAMVPFSFLSDADRWALAFYVTGLRHVEVPADDAPTYTLAELSVRSDEDLRRELGAAGFPEARIPSLLADLRRRAPYEDRAGKSPLGLARARLDRARIEVARGQRAAARAAVIDAYLEGIEPAESALRAADAALVTSIEERFLALRGRLDAGAPPPEVDEAVGALLADVTRAERLLGSGGAGDRTFLSTAVASGTILLREGVEAALLIAALLGIATRAGLGERKRWVHAGWVSAVGLGLCTWILSTRLIAISGAQPRADRGRDRAPGHGGALLRELLAPRQEGGGPLDEVPPGPGLAAPGGRLPVRGGVPGRLPRGLRDGALLPDPARRTRLHHRRARRPRRGRGAPGGAGRGLLAGRPLRAPADLLPGVELPALRHRRGLRRAGRGRLQLTGLVPIHALPVPSVPALGLHPTLETCAAQGALLALALVAFLVSLRAPLEPAPKPDAKPEAAEGGAGVPAAH